MSGKRKKGVPRVRNFVQMHVQDFNRPQVFEDKKQKLRRGYEKHRGAAIKKASWGETREAFLMAVRKGSELVARVVPDAPFLKIGGDEMRFGVVPEHP